MQLNPEATYDCLFVAGRLQELREGFSTPELHLFPYLACLLSLYQKNTVGDWGYGFVGTELGAPFSKEIDTAINHLLNRGWLFRRDDRLRVNNEALVPLRELGQLELNARRSDCLSAACASTVALSVGIVGSALSQEPELKRASRIPMTRQLLEAPGQSGLYEQFEALRQHLAAESDLRLPALVWLTALYRSALSTENG